MAAVREYVNRVQPQLAADPRFKDVRLLGYSCDYITHPYIPVDGTVPSQQDWEALEQFIRTSRPPSLFQCAPSVLVYEKMRIKLRIRFSLQRVVSSALLSGKGRRSSKLQPILPTGRRSGQIHPRVLVISAIHKAVFIPIVFTVFGSRNEIYGCLIRFWR